jgi:hypothetical protein
VLGLRQRGPRLVVASGTLIIALGPAFCSPLNGVGALTLNPHDSLATTQAHENLGARSPKLNAWISVHLMAAGIVSDVEGYVLLGSLVGAGARVRRCIRAGLIRL